MDPVALARAKETASRSHRMEEEEYAAAFDTSVEER
jgi:hypothetical protein